MAGSLNRVTLIGNLGADPEIRTMQDGREMANINVATTDSWRDKTTGEKKEKTEWHRVVVFGEGIVNVVKNYLKKGSKIYLEGSLQTRKWTDQSGQDKYTTEVVLQGFNGTLIMLDRREGGSSGSNYSQSAAAKPKIAAVGGGGENFVDNDLDDDIPF